MNRSEAMRRRRRIVRTAILYTCLLTTVAGCSRSQGPARDDPVFWLPLSGDDVAVYETRYANWFGAGAQAGRSIVTRRATDGAIVHRFDDLLSAHLSRTPEGIVARRDDMPDGGDTRPGFVPIDGATVLPAQITRGARWQRESYVSLVPTVSCRLCEHEGNIRTRVTIAFHVRDVGISHDVPAGSFDDVLVIEGAVSKETDTGSAVGRRPVELITIEYYAPGVGLIETRTKEVVRDTHDDYFGSFHARLLDVY